MKPATRESLNLHRGRLNQTRAFKAVRLGVGSIEIEIMEYCEGDACLQPLIILSPIEFPCPPSVAFCECMKQNGFRVVYVRRFGTGATPNLPLQLLTTENIREGAAVTTEAALISRVISELRLQNCILLGMSSSNPICYRLCLMHPDICLTVFSHPIFNQDTFGTVRPFWFQAILRQIIFTKSGFKLSANGLRYYIKHHPLSFYDQLYSKSAADLQYRRDNEEDFLKAARLVIENSAANLYYDAVQTLAEDSLLKDGLFLNVRAVVFAGSETTTTWLSNAKLEAERLAVPFEQASEGGILAAYASPNTLSKVIKDHLP